MRDANCRTCQAVYLLDLPRCCEGRCVVAESQVQGYIKLHRCDDGPWMEDLCDDEEVPATLHPPDYKPYLALVQACPDRGSTLPVSEQPSCGCAELTACQAQRGAKPGKVTLRECLVCQGFPA